MTIKTIQDEIQRSCYSLLIDHIASFLSYFHFKDFHAVATLFNKNLFAINTPFNIAGMFILQNYLIPGLLPKS